MKSRKHSILIYVGILTVWCLSWGGCSTTQVAPPAPPTPPSFTQVPHPVTYELGDLKGVFYEQGAPDRESLKDCDKGFHKLMAATSSVEERNAGVAELVRHDPVAMHWCFYDRVAFLEEDMKKEPYIDQRQKKVLATYDFLVPIARAYSTEFHDSRYLRAAIQRYRKLSEWVFFRRLDLSPKVTSELVEMATPFGIWRQPGGPTPVLEKYGVVQPPTAAVTGAGAAPEVVPAPATAPLTDSSPQDRAPATVTGTSAPAASTPNNQAIAAQPEPVAPPPPAPVATPATSEVLLDGDQVLNPPPVPPAGK